MADTFNSKHGLGGEKQKQIQVMWGWGCVCAGGGREGLGSCVAFLSLPFLCKPNVTRKTD